MGWLTSILRALAPIAVEHGGQVLRDSLKARASQGQPAGPDLNQLAADVEQLKSYALELKSEIETLNQTVAAREEWLRKWVVRLLIWNLLLMAALVVIAILALRH